VTAYRAEVIADNSGKWCGHGLTFRTEADAQTWVNDLALRWFLVRDTRVVAIQVDPEEVNR
jgi:hypothetical protein